MLKIIKLNDEIIDDFNKNHTIYLKHKSLEGNIARYFLEKYIGYSPTEKNNIPIFENNIYYNLSHKDGLVFIGYDTKPIGIDIEIVKSRDIAIFALHSDIEYYRLGGTNLENFYYLWTIKESIIKLYLSSIDYLGDIDIFDIKKVDKTIDNIKFNYIFNGRFKNRNFNGYSGKTNNIIYSICYDK